MEFYNKINVYFKEVELDKFSYTVLINSTKLDEIINQISKKIDGINKKSMDSFKKKKINDRLFALKTKLENIYKIEDDLNIFILVNENIEIFPLSKKDIQFCKEWNISKFLFIQNGIDINSYDGTHESIVKFINEFISTDKVKTVFKFDKSSFSVNQIDSTKSKTIESHSINEELIKTLISKYNPFVVYGLNPYVKKMTSENKTDSIQASYKNLSKDEILELINKHEIIENQQKFKSVFLDNINNPAYDEKFLFGPKEVSWGLNNYMVKHLFINPKLFTNFKNSDDSSIRELISNIKITIVQPIETGDLGFTLNKNYGGTVALKYY